MANDPYCGMTLNARALALLEGFWTRARDLRVEHHHIAGARVVDCGSNALGGLETGLALARVCMAGLGHVSISPAPMGHRSWPYVHVITDHPVAACLASQYAGWQINAVKFHAMGSGPMRAAAAREPIFERGLVYRETADAVVGVLECRKPPDEKVIADIAQACGVPPERVSLLFAPTASQAGTVQIVARSVETALHKLLELNFDLKRIVSAQGSAPLPPVAKDDLEAIGRTNDAILYGASVWLTVTGDDESLQDVGARLPSSASRDHGAPFAEIFARYNNDFYAVDPLLFSPACVTFQNLTTGRVHEFGRLSVPTVNRSFGLTGS